ELLGDAVPLALARGFARRELAFRHREPAEALHQRLALVPNRSELARLLGVANAVQPLREQAPSEGDLVEETERALEPRLDLGERAGARGRLEHRGQLPHELLGTLDEIARASHVVDHP